MQQPPTKPLISPARIDFSDPAAPKAPDFGDIYHARAGAAGQAQHVFLGGNQLPQRWQGRHRFVVLETGFGLGHNFLATWAAWQSDPKRCGTLWFVAIDRHPPQRDDLGRAHGAPAYGCC
jgi:tRNA 5-methylaminomethyl-2-thiouridine biosynthesis bifunctional protein